MQSIATTVVRDQAKIWDDAVSPVEGISVKPLIELAITETRAEAGFVYQFDRENHRTSLMLPVGRVLASPVPAAEIDRITKSIHWNRATPVVLHQGASSDWRFAPLPEFRRGKYEAVVSIPLVDQAMTVGVANFCRKEPDLWKARDVAFLLSLSLPVGAVIAASAVKNELARTAQKLADSKVLDRAKGLLQSRLGWSEEEAYLQMRRLSRQRRIPMREIAREIIEAGAGRFALPEAHDGN